MGNSQKKPVKVSICISYAKKRNTYRVMWRELSTGKNHNRSFKTIEDARNEYDEILCRLVREAIAEGYDTTESRIRKYIKLRDMLHGVVCDGDGKFSARENALRGAGIHRQTAADGVKIIYAIDDLVDRGEHEKAYQIRADLLTASVGRVAKRLPDEYRYSDKKRTENSLSVQIGGLARALDRLHDKRGGTGYRDECMSLLKQLSAKYDEWRASE